VEADPDALTGLVPECIDESLQWPSAAGREIAAVAFASFLHGMIGTDGEGRALTPVITWADFRSIEQADRLGSRMDDPQEVRQRTGCPLHPLYFPSKLLWVRENQPQIFKDVDWWCSIGEYCLRRFTGRMSCSLSMASGSGLLDRRTGCCDGELLAGLGVDESRFSPLGDLDFPVHALRSPYANRWPGLRDSAWFPALGDGACSNVGCGCATGNRIALMVGTTGAMRAVRPAGDAHVPDGLWAYRMDRTRELVGGVLGDGGNLFEWMSTTLDLGLTPKEIDEALLAAAPAGHGLTILPFLTGERSTGWNPRARGAVIGLRLETKGLVLLQAGVEAIAYRFAAILRVLRPAAPDARDDIGTGGALSAAAWARSLPTSSSCPFPAPTSPKHPAGARQFSRWKRWASSRARMPHGPASRGPFSREPEQRRRIVPRPWNRNASASSSPLLCLPPLPLPPHAVVALASLRLDQVVEVFPPVVVGQLFTRSDVPAGVDQDAHSAGARFAVRPAGVVDVTADVFPSRTVDDPPRVHLEEVAPAFAVCLFARKQPPGVFHDQSASRNLFSSEQPEPARRPLDGKFLEAAACLVSSCGHGDGGYTDHSRGAIPPRVAW